MASQDIEAMTTSLQVPAPYIPRKVIRSVQCNSMHYTDPTRGMRQIWMPQGTMGKASKLLEDENWDELAKFELWSKSICIDAII